MPAFDESQCLILELSPETTLAARAQIREKLLCAVRAYTPILISVASSPDWKNLPEREDRHAALCEMLSYATFLILDTETALYIGVPAYEGRHGSGDMALGSLECPDPEEILRAMQLRFDLTSVVLTDEGMAFDGEKITAI